ncbi:uncharacterized protein PRCAT00006098001 [Priceomyces carsonii]|uniref:uncharacterized protein n=1 Tax=Priceomyces carsonii TaxID=28549 RepID=UPI002EDA7630|nr:unnamed protein product [Priceomyces carsonii]
MKLRDNKVSNKIPKHKGQIKKPSKSKTKSKSKATKAQIAKINEKVQDFDEITQLLGKGAFRKEDRKTLDASSLRMELKKDKDNQKRNAKVENQISEQLELLTGIEL